MRGATELVLGPSSAVVWSESMVPLLPVLALGCSALDAAEVSGVGGSPFNCAPDDGSVLLGSFPEGTNGEWEPFEDGDPLCFRTGPSGNGSTWPEFRVTGRSGHGKVTTRLVRDGELLYEYHYDEVMSRPADDLCVYTSHFYLWLPVERVESFDGRSAVLAVLHEDELDPEAVMLQDTVSVVPQVCNPEDDL